MDCHALLTHNLAAGYRHGRRQVEILHGLDLHLSPGMFTALLGANGSGKSTLLRTITGSLAPLDGTVLLDGCDIRHMSRRQMARALAIVTTERALAGGLTVEQLVALGRQPYTGISGRLSPDDSRFVDSAMDAVAISHKRLEPLARLSDGERQKAMIARALAQDTPVIILDEPTAFLDPAGRLEVMTLLANLANDSSRRRAILLSTHDVALATSLCSHLWLIDRCEGSVIAGPTTQIIDSGRMDCLFPEHDIVFDRAASDFRPRL